MTLPPTWSVTSMPKGKKREVVGTSSINKYLDKGNVEQVMSQEPLGSKVSPIDDLKGFLTIEWQKISHDIGDLKWDVKIYWHASCHHRR